MRANTGASLMVALLLGCAVGAPPNGVSPKPITLWETELEWDISGTVNACAVGGKSGEVLAAATSGGQLLAWQPGPWREPMRVGLEEVYWYGVAVDRAGRMVAAVGERGLDVPVGMILDLKSGWHQAFVPGTKGATKVLFSPDGSLLIFYGGREGGVWLGVVRSATSGEMEGRSLAGHTRKVLAAAFSPDGTRVVTGSWDRSVRIWEIGHPENAPTVLELNSPVNGVGFSPDGLTIATASGPTASWQTALGPDGVRLWGAATGKPLAPLPGWWGHATSVSFSPDGAHLAAGFVGSETRIWRVGAKTDPISLAGDNQISFSPNGEFLLTWGWGPMARVWRVDTGEEVTEIGHAGGQHTSALWRGGSSRIVSCSSYQDIREWDATRPAWTGEIVEAGRTLLLKGHDAAVWNLAASPDGKWLASASHGDKSVRVWDLVNQGPPKVHRFLDGPSSVAFAPGSQTLLIGGPSSLDRGDGFVYIWQAPWEDEPEPYLSLDWAPWSMRLDDSGRLLALRLVDSQLHWFRAKCRFQRRGETVLDLQPEGQAEECAISADGEAYGMVTLDGHILVGDINGEDRWGLQIEEQVSAAAFSPDLEYAATSLEDGRLLLHQHSPGAAPASTVLGGCPEGGGSSGIAFGPTGDTVAMICSRGDGVVYLLDSQNPTGGQEMQTIPGPFPSHPAGITFSPDGRWVYAALSDNTIIGWLLAER